MHAQRRSTESIVEILRECRREALAQAAKDKARELWILEALESGRASGFRFALALLDPDGPEQKELDAVLSARLANVSPVDEVAMVNGRSGEPAASPVFLEGKQ